MAWKTCSHAEVPQGAGPVYPTETGEVTYWEPDDAPAKAADPPKPAADPEPHQRPRK